MGIGMDYLAPFKLLYNYLDKREKAKLINEIYSFKEPIKGRYSNIPNPAVKPKKPVIKLSDL